MNNLRIFPIPLGLASNRLLRIVSFGTERPAYIEAMKLTTCVIQKLPSFAMVAALGGAALHGQTLIDLKTQSKSVDFSGASATKPFKTGTVLPASCGVGELFFQVGAAGGKNSYGCTAANTWTLQSGGGSGSGLPTQTNSAHQVLSTDGTNAAWSAIGGDLTGAPQTLTVGGLQGRPLAGTQPADGQVIRWNNSAHDWEPGAIGIVANYAKPFTNASMVMIAGTSHNLGTANLIVNCYDNSTPAVLLVPSSVTVDPSTYNVAVTFATAKTGQCVVNGSGGNGIAPSTGGDLAGVISNATVAGLQRHPVSASTPTDGQVLTWSQNNGQWQPQIALTGAAGTGVQFNALSASFGTATILNLGLACSSASPCNMRFGNTVFSISSSSTASLQSGSGTAYIYMTSAGALTVGSNMSIVCSSGCVTASGVFGFPANSIPLFTWQAQPGGWDPNGGADLRSYLSTKLLAPGAGLVLLDSGIQSTLSVDSTIVPTYLTGSASLSFGTLAGNSCAADMTMSVPGVNTGDPVAAGWPSAMPAGVLGMMSASTGNTVSVRLCNIGATPVSVPVGVYQATIVRSL